MMKLGLVHHCFIDKLLYIDIFLKCSEDIDKCRIITFTMDASDIDTIDPQSVHWLPTETILP